MPLAGLSDWNVVEEKLGTGGVGLMVKDELVDSVLAMERRSGRVIVVVNSDIIGKVNESENDLGACATARKGRRKRKLE